jgi:hypothetical protein
VGDVKLIDDCCGKTSIKRSFCDAKLVIFAELSKKSAKKAVILHYKA